MQKSTESRLERKATFNIYYYFPKAYFNVASHSAPAFPAPPPQHLLPSGASGARNQHNLRSSALVPRAGACCGQSRSRPGGRSALRMLNPPPLGSSHCTSAPRLRPAPAAPAPPCRAPPGSGTPAPRPRHAHSLCSDAPRRECPGPHLPVPAQQELRGSPAPRLGFRVSLVRKPKKGVTSNFQSWEGSQAFLCHPPLLSLQLQLPLPKNPKYPYVFE